MENKNINLTELLKDCPIGMKLYSPIFGDVYLNKIRPHLAIVVTTDKEQGDFKEEFLYDGRYWINGECMLFPSKDQRDWGKFQIPPFKDGDILACNQVGNKNPTIYIYSYNETQLSTYYVALIGNKLKISNTYFSTLSSINENMTRFATEEEKEKLFKELKHQGYCWNTETKNLEKLIEPKFKVGDIIQGYDGSKVEITEVDIDNERYLFRPKIFGMLCAIVFKNQDKWDLVPNKFDISTLVPFESRVLVRHTKDEIWKPAIFGCYTGYRYYVLGNVHWVYCIPYEGNEHLCGKIDDCDEYYKTWKS